MAEALELAMRGRGHVEPNPRVGAVALRGDRVVGRGWHRHYGGPHAEVEALADAAGRGEAPDTVVVTLEPCSSEPGDGGKKTPPCTRALIDAGVRRVVVGARDPDPRHGGRGVAALEDAGVEVVTGVLESRFEEQNAAFARGLNLDRPWTISKWAMTLDGKTATHRGESRWISGEAARVRVHELRARVDAVVVGHRTAQLDDPELTVRHVEGRDPVRIVVDPRAELAEDSRLVRSAERAPVWIVAGADAPADRVARLQQLGVTVIEAPAGQGGQGLQLSVAWRELRRRGVRRVLVEGGGVLMAALTEEGCVDQVLCFVAPKMVGGRDAPSPLSGAGKALMSEAWVLDELTVEPCGDDLAIGAFVAPC